MTSSPSLPVAISIARDIGIDLKCYAHLSDLKRIWVNPFSDQHMYEVDDIDMETISLNEYFKNDSNLPVINLEYAQAKQLAYGKSIKLDGTQHCAAFYNDTFIGIIAPCENSFYKSVKLRANIINLLH